MYQKLLPMNFVQKSLYQPTKRASCPSSVPSIDLIMTVSGVENYHLTFDNWVDNSMHSYIDIHIIHIKTPDWAVLWFQDRVRSLCELCDIPCFNHTRVYVMYIDYRSYYIHYITYHNHVSFIKVLFNYNMNILITHLHYICKCISNIAYITCIMPVSIMHVHLWRNDMFVSFIIDF